MDQIVHRRSLSPCIWNHLCKQRDIGELVRFAYAVTSGPITRSMLEAAVKHIDDLELFLNTDFDDVCEKFASPGEYLADGIYGIEDIPSE